jgi:anti-sigma regulatory factor (Ser/Thr protein kinase)
MNVDRNKLPETVADLRWRGPAVARRLAAVRHELVDWASRTGLSGGDVDGLALAGYEAMANVVTHAYGDQIGVLDVQATVSPDLDAVAVTVTVTDYGRWRPPPADPGLLHGRGLPLIRHMAHTADIFPTPHGTTVHMRWSLPHRLSTHG